MMEPTWFWYGGIRSVLENAEDADQLLRECGGTHLILIWRHQECPGKCQECGPAFEGLIGPTWFWYGGIRSVLENAKDVDQLERNTLLVHLQHAAEQYQHHVAQTVNERWKSTRLGKEQLFRPFSKAKSTEEYVRNWQCSAEMQGCWASYLLASLKLKSFQLLSTRC